MLHLIPAPLHRLGLRAAHAIRKRWWRVAKVTLCGCRVMAFDADGRVLLIRHSYGSGSWMLPGGGIGRGEPPLAAAQRELLEETGCRLDQPRCLVRIDEPLYGTLNQVYLVSGTARGTLHCDGREVIEAQFFAPEALPEDLSPALAARFASWLALARANS